MIDIEHDTMDESVKVKAQETLCRSQVRINESKVFLTAEWKHLAILNYEIEPSALAPFVPAGTELDLWEGKIFVSVVGKTVFIVVKMEFKDGPDRFTLYLNPTPGNPEPAASAVKDDLDLEFAEQLFLYSRAAWSVDEIRLGTTWEAVTPAWKEWAR